MSSLREGVVGSVLEISRGGLVHGRSGSRSVGDEHFCSETLPERATGSLDSVGTSPESEVASGLVSLRRSGTEAAVTRRVQLGSPRRVLISVADTDGSC